MKTPQEKSFLSMLIRIDYTISSMACSVQCPPRKPYWDEDNKLCVSMKPFVTFIVQSYFDTLLRYVLSVTFCGAVVLKVMDQKTLVKRR